MMMSRHPALIRALLATALAVAAAAGCRDMSAGYAGQPYRTIVAEPSRDTEAAREANREGLERLEARDLEGAARAFQEALASDVEFGPAHNNLGKVYYRRGRLYKAAWEFEYARKCLPRRAEPHNNLGLVLEAAGELDRAVEAYREAARLDPRAVAYRANLARALLRRGDRTDEVRELLAEVLREDKRPEWLIWARRRLAALGGPGGAGK